MARKARKRKKKAKEPFWKKIKNPELKRLAEHIGKITDNTNWKDFLDVALALTCAGAGWLAAENLGVKDWKIKGGMALSGAIAYRLATSANLIAGASGTALIGTYGLIDVWNPLTGWFQESIPKTPEEAKKQIKEKLGKITSWKWWITPKYPWETWSWAYPWVP